MSNRFCFATLVLVVSSFVVAGPAISGEFGRFEGTVQVEWLDDGREMKTITPVTYFDPNGKAWTVPAGTKTDGASTPQATWTMYPPYAGKYRKAALIHDYFCENKSHSWQDTHDMFYYALRASGMDSLNSNIMWTAVYMQGPRWDIATKRSLRVATVELTPEQKKQQFDAIADWVKKKNPSRAEIKKAIEQGKVQKMSRTNEEIQ